MVNVNKFNLEEIRVPQYLFGKSPVTLINHPETFCPVSMISQITQDTNYSTIYQTGIQTLQQQVASKDFNGKCIDRFMREIGQMLSSVITDHATNVDVQKSALEVSDVKIGLLDETQKQDMVPISIVQILHQRSRSTTMNIENILCVEQDKQEGTNSKFRITLIKFILQDVQQLGANPTDRPIHFKFIGSYLKQRTRVFVQSDFGANSFISEEQKAFKVHSALITNGDMLQISKCNFIDCNSSAFGSAIFLICNSNGQATLDQVQFINCRSNSGGGMYGIAQSNGTILIKQCNFTDCNSNGRDGGGSGLMAIINERGQFTISGVCIFKNCSCSDTSSIGGGCYIHAYEPNYNINIAGELLFERCKGYQGGGLAIYLDNVGQFQMNILSFNECSSFGSGGGGFDFQIQTQLQLTITGKCSFCNCSSPSSSVGSGVGGGLILSTWEQGSKLNFTGELEFDQCKANYGGGMYILIQQLRILEINNATFKDCSSNLDGGGLYMSIQYSGVIDIISSQFLNCSASNSGGGGLYCYIGSNQSVKFRDLTFDNCSAVNGGAIYSNINAGGKLIIENSCKLSQCKATLGNGGGIFVYINNFTSQFEFKINNSIISECEAKSDTSYDIPPTGYGGGIFLFGSGEYDQLTQSIDLRGMKIYNNSADKAGQSLYVVMTKVEEWCKYGGEGEYVKGNYSDGISNKNELQGIPVNLQVFNQYSTQNISSQQKYLEDYWNEVEDQPE
ncbi:MAG: hypothetical protein EZS28_024031 [Streblomastix strix]|uniref:Uncharacterized protein n=1 Tax=Streblomastix strix TaxID=222440 RepID=A0A5J4VD82_9EUKA|nr:MAG: hypothetical protein EZS28_024031 [Streblomastix strix]